MQSISYNMLLTKKDWYTTPELKTELEKEYYETTLAEQFEKGIEKLNATIQDEEFWKIARRNLHAAIEPTEVCELEQKIRTGQIESTRLYEVQGSEYVDGYLKKKRVLFGKIDGDYICASRMGSGLGMKNEAQIYINIPQNVMLVESTMHRKALSSQLGALILGELVHCEGYGRGEEESPSMLTYRAMLQYCLKVEKIYK